MRQPLENVVMQCLMACELLARQNLGLSHEKLKFGISNIYEESGHPLDEKTLNVLCETVGKVMRSTGLVIDYDGFYFWKGADPVPEIAEEFLN